MARRALSLVGVSVAYASVLVVLRGRPSVKTDSGVFLSVAARLLRGDHLYAGVWDNKDPLFYWTYAGALEAGGWRGPFLLDIVWVAIAAASIWLLLRLMGASRLVAAVGFVMYPLLLTGAWYYAGYSELAPLALSPALTWLWMRGNARTTGFMLGILLMFRLDYAPLFGCLLVGAALIGLPTNVRRKVIIASVTLAATLGAALLVLALRAELSPYVQTMIDNARYSDAALAQRGKSGVIGHLSVAWTFLTPHRAILLIVLTAAGVVLAAVVLRAPDRKHRVDGSRAGFEPIGNIAVLYLGSTLGTAVILALTTLWDHHLELIALPGALLCAMVVARIEMAPTGRVGLAGTRLVVGVALIMLTAAAAFGGLPHSRQQSLPLSAWLDSPDSPTADALNAVASSALPHLRVVTYTHLGSNDEDGHAAFLAKRFKLACPVFQEYTFSANLDSALQCLEGKEPELVLVTPSLRPVQSRLDKTWNAFVSSARRFLAKRYSRVLVVGPSTAGIEIWERRAVAE